MLLYYADYYNSFLSRLLTSIIFGAIEIRPALHMDNLVSIYKNMEVASGVNIFVTQTNPSSKLQGNIPSLVIHQSCEAFACTNAPTIVMSICSTRVFEIDSLMC